MLFTNFSGEPPLEPPLDRPSDLTHHTFAYASVRGGPDVNRSTDPSYTTREEYEEKSGWTYFWCVSEGICQPEYIRARLDFDVVGGGSTQQ
jgi:hypothetical protein